MRTETALLHDHRARRTRLLPTHAQLYATDFAPLVEGSTARLLLQPGCPLLTLGEVVEYVGTTKRFLLRLDAYLAERKGRGRKPRRSDRVAATVVAIEGGARGAGDASPKGERALAPLVPTEPRRCTVCHGSGAIEIPGPCPECHGRANGCPDCEDTGRLDWSECRACHGKGLTDG